MDPWAAALDSMFMAPGSAAAVYQPVEGVPRHIRVIRSAPDRTTGFGDGQIINTSTALELRASDVPTPQRGDMIIIGGTLADGVITGGEIFELFGDPILDLERLGWTCGAEPVT